MGNVIEFGKKGCESLYEQEKARVMARCTELMNEKVDEGWEVVKSLVISNGGGFGMLYNLERDGRGYIEFVDWTGEAHRLCDWDDRKEAEWMFEGLLYQAERTFYDGADKGAKEAMAVYGKGGSRSYDKVRKVEEGFKVCR